MLSINTNISSLVAQHSMKSATQLLNQAVERMTTGYKINHAKDNAANYSIATNLTTKINSYMVAEENCAMGLDLLATANGSLDQISDKLTRLRDLATQAGNGTYGTQSLNAINAEANALVDEINRLYSTAEYNGRKLFSDNVSTPAVATYGTRASGTNTTYTDTEVAAMTALTDAITAVSSGQKYSISTVDELVNLAELVNSGVDTTGVEFVLGADIDLSSISNWTPIGNNTNQFKGIFDGNGHIIENLVIDNGSQGYQGLFGYTTSGSSIKNVGLESGSVKSSGSHTGALVGFSYSNITNCYSKITVEGGQNTGGLVGYAYGLIKNCYTLSNVKGGANVGGLVGYLATTIENSYVSAGDISGSSNVGGLVGNTIMRASITNSYSSANSVKTGVNGNTGSLVGYVSLYSTLTNCYNTNATEFVGYLPSSVTLNNCATTGTYKVDQATKMSEEEILSNYTPDVMGFTAANGWTIVNGQPLLSWQSEAQVVPDPDSPVGGTGGGGSPTGPSPAPDTVLLQVGVDSGWASQIGISIKFTLDNPDELRMIGLDLTTDYLTKIDEMLATVSERQTEYGSAQNRLESALESIIVNIENLTSSRSTIRDADIAEVSSEYIRQQILQQASATLMATANQSPSIALQLI